MFAETLKDGITKDLGRKWGEGGKGADERGDR